MYVFTSSFAMSESVSCCRWIAMSGNRLMASKKWRINCINFILLCLPAVSLLLFKKSDRLLVLRNCLCCQSSKRQDLTVICHVQLELLYTFRLTSKLVTEGLCKNWQIPNRLTCVASIQTHEVVLHGSHGAEVNITRGNFKSVCCPCIDTAVKFFDSIPAGGNNAPNSNLPLHIFEQPTFKPKTCCTQFVLFIRFGANQCAMFIVVFGMSLSTKPAACHPPSSLPQCPLDPQRSLQGTHVSKTVKPKLWSWQPWKKVCSAIMSYR